MWLLLYEPSSDQLQIKYEKKKPNYYKTKLNHYINYVTF